MQDKHCQPKKDCLFRWNHLAYLVLFTFIFSACNTARYLKPEDKLLKKNDIVFKDKVEGINTGDLEQDLNLIINQKPNERLLFLIPREWIYLANAEPGDTSWFEKGMQNIGQVPVIFKEEEAKQTVQDFQNYLRNEQGFFDAVVDFTTDEKSRVRSHTNSFGTSISTPNKVKVQYLVDAKERYKIKSIHYTSGDSAISSIIKKNLASSYLKAGNYFNLTDFNLEKSRITLDLQNVGYYNFNTNFIDIVADSNKTTKEIDFWFEIAPPANASKHTAYSIGKISVYPDYYKEFEFIQPSSKTDTLGMTFYFYGKKQMMKPAVLKKSIFLQTGDKYTFESRQKTFRKLNTLTPYRFVNITTTPRIDSDSIVDINVLLTPQENKYIMESVLEAYYSSFDLFNLLGMSLSGNLIDRNFLRGGENLSLRGQFGFGLNIGRAEDGTRIFNLQSRNISLTSNLQVPSHVDFLGLSRFVNRIGIVPDRFYKNFDAEAKTNISLGFTSLKFFNFYEFNSLNAAFGYEYTSPKGHRYIFRPMGINFDQYSILDTSQFSDLPIIFLQFRDVLGTGLFFRDFTHVYNGVRNRKGRSFAIINKVEFSGLEIGLLNRLFNVIGNNDDEWHISLPGDKKINFAQYIKYEFDYRYNREFSPKHSLAFRFNTGVAVPFNRDNVVPFIKQFGLGGPNSMRAWNIRQLGPGGYVDPLYKLETPSDLNIYIQQGDLKLETNLEYRFNIFLFVDGAVFVDAGNIWNLREQPGFQNAHISGKFYNQIAVAAGYGLRLNFVFFNIRFDTGYKIRSPYRDPYLNRNWYSWKEIVNQGVGNIQVAVNYPF